MANVDCPICSRALALTDSHKGRKVRCPGCETRMRFRKNGTLELLPLKDGSKPTVKPPAPAPPAPEATAEKSDSRFSDYDDVIRIGGYVGAALIAGMLCLLMLFSILALWILLPGVMAMAVLICLLPLLKKGKGIGIKSDHVAKGLQVAKGIQKSIDTLKSELPKSSSDPASPKVEPAKKSEDPGEETKDVPTQGTDDPGEETKDVPTQGTDDPGEETKDVPTQGGNDSGEETRPVPTQGADDSGEETKEVPTQQGGNDPGEDTRPVPKSGS